MLICTGKFTKRIEEFQSQEKEYEAVFTIGAVTSSHDLEKPIEQYCDYSYVNEQLILEACDKLSGTYHQLPPVFSAVKIEGKRAYEYARNNEEINIQSKLITISKMEITNINLPEIKFKIICSKGTYIRSLVRDFGEILQCGAYLSGLCRTRIGNFQLKDALELDELKNAIYFQNL